MKKLVSLLLVAVLVFTFMAVSVSAADIQGDLIARGVAEAPVVLPRAACPQCGGSGFDSVYSMEEVPDSHVFVTCKYKIISHQHDKGDVYLTTTCRTCRTVLHSGYAGKGERCTYNKKVWL